MISERLTQGNFDRLMDKYQREQKGLIEEVNGYESAETELADKRTDAKKCVDLLARYADIETLTPEILKTLISRIVVHECQPVNGDMRQKLDIYYRHAGVVNSCEFCSLTCYHPKHVTTPTRKRHPRVQKEQIS